MLQRSRKPAFVIAFVTQRNLFNLHLSKMLLLFLFFTSIWILYVIQVC